MKENKKISVIVTIYNTPENYLKRCIESIRKQTLKDIEIVLVNDGSNDKIRSICEQYAKKDERVKLINQENMGVSVARNVGIKNSTSENITFVDSDDWIETETCEKLYLYIKKLKKYDIIIFNCYVDYTKKSIKNKFYYKEGLLNKEDIEEIQLQNIEKGITKYYPEIINISIACAKVYRKDFLQAKNIKYIPNLIRMEDNIFNMEAFEKAKEIYICQEYLYHYQQNDFSVCQSYSKDTIKYYEKYFEFVQEYIKKYNKNERFKDTLNLRIITSIYNYMNNYFFHKDNPESKAKMKKELKELLNKKIYQDAMGNVKKEYLSTYQKLILENAKNKNINMMIILKKVKIILKQFLNYK